MANDAGNETKRRGSRWRWIGWSIPVLLLLLPAIAMQFTEEVNWTAFDFVFAAMLFGSVGLAFEFIVRRSQSLSYRLGAALAVIAAFLTIWVNGAVGMIGDEDGGYNLIFLGVLFVGLLGSVLARLEPAGMVRAMLVTAIAQVAAGAGGLAVDPLGGVFSMGFGGFWLLAAALFWNAARDREAPGAAGRA